MTKTVPVKDLRRDLGPLLDEVSDRREHIVVTRHGRPAAVIIPHDEYTALEETADVLADPAEVDQPEQHDEGDPDGPGGQRDELPQVGLAEGDRRGGGRGDAGAHHRERDDEGEERDAERAVGVERRTRGPRVTCRPAPGS